MSPALAGRFSTTAPPGKPHSLLLKAIMIFTGVDNTPFQFLTFKTVATSLFQLDLSWWDSATLSMVFVITGASVRIGTTRTCNLGYFPSTKVLDIHVTWENSHSFLHSLSNHLMSTSYLCIWVEGA